MNPSTPGQFIKLEIDAEQWQRDIRTFAETTNQALQAIVAQLSNSCSLGHVAASNQNPTRLNEQCTASITTPESESHSPFATDPFGDKNRLSELKQQLAQRISKSR
jgi:hypothetical protein